MTLKSNVRFTPELLITAPRRSPAIPNTDGTHAFYTVSTYSLDSHSETNELKVIHLETEEVTLFSDDPKIGSPRWLVGNQLLWTKSIDGGKTEIWIGSAGTAEKNSYLAGTINSSIGNLRTTELSDGNIAIGFSALVSESGSILNAASIEKPLSSAREYESAQVRFFDTYYEKEQSTLWYSLLEKDEATFKYRLSKEPFINALHGSELSFPVWPIDALSSDGEFQLAEHGLVILTFDPELDQKNEFAMKLFYIEITKFTSPPKSIHKIDAGVDGIYTSPVFSGDGRSLAFLATGSIKRTDDFSRIFAIRSIADRTPVVEIIPVREEGWDVNPGSIVLSNSGDELYLVAEERAQIKLWKLSLDSLSSTSSKVEISPTLLSDKQGSVISVFPLGYCSNHGKLLINTTSLVDSGSFYIRDTSSKTGVKKFAQFAHNELSLGVRRSQVSEINFKSKGDYDVHAWIFKPSDFDPKKTYPLVLFIHGGPAITWNDTWSTRWNPAVWADQGYVVVLPNPSGSSSFGRAFQESVLGDWGGRPYDDLVCCFEYVEKNMPFVDIDRAVAAGSSYGGYMANWIAGQPLAKRLKTIICHDGIFSNYNMLASDVPYITSGDMGGDLWDPKAKILWDKWDPAQFTENWTTPMLFIHSDNDFRCPISEGLAPYNVCQLKGIPCRFLNFPDENHFVKKRENSLRWHKTVLGWANKYAGVEGKIELEPPVTEPRSKGPKNRVVIKRDRW